MVIGAARGIGHAYCEALLQKGAKVGKQERTTMKVHRHRKKLLLPQAMQCEQCDAGALDMILDCFSRCTSVMSCRTLERRPRNVSRSSTVLKRSSSAKWTSPC